VSSFDAIDHHVLMERVRRRIKDRKVLRLVLAFLKADIMIEGSLRHSVTGTPQGGVISPLELCRKVGDDGVRKAA
jgi:retron-type reverse transcriptase